MPCRIGRRSDACKLLHPREHHSRRRRRARHQSSKRVHDGEPTSLLPQIQASVLLGEGSFGAEHCNSCAMTGRGGTEQVRWRESEPASCFVAA